MRRLTTAITLAVLLVTGAVPAAAGSADNPEITDPCGAQVRTTDDSLTIVPGHVDICAGWFDTTASGLKVTLQTSGPTSPEPGFWAVWWNNGDCTYEVAVDDSATAAHARTFRVGCGEPPEPRCSPPILALECNYADYYRDFELPAGAVEREGNQVRVTVDFSGALAEFAPAHARGQVLTHPRAWAATVVGPVYAYTLGCSFGDLGTFCFDAGGDHTLDGRSYTVGT